MQESNNPSSDPSVPQREAVSAARRRILRGSLGVVPVGLAITTRPARAWSTLQCQSPSAAQSVNTSRVENVQVCYGRSPEYWRDPSHHDKWPYPYVAKDDAATGLKASEFHAMGCSGGQFGNATMLKVLEMGMNGGGQVELGAYVVAGVLNAAGGMTPVIDVPGVLNLWNECTRRGYYEAMAGVRWSSSEVVQYLRSTMTG